MGSSQKVIGATGAVAEWGIDLSTAEREFYQECADERGITLEQWLDLAFEIEGVIKCT